MTSQGAPGRVAQSLTCLATGVCLAADPVAASSILAQSHIFVEIDHEIIPHSRLIIREAFFAHFLILMSVTG